MRYLIILFMFFFAGLSQAQEAPSVTDFFAAQWYNHFEGDARVSMVQQLQGHGWYAIDTFYEMATDAGNTSYHTEKHYLAPYLDDNGIVVHLVPDVAPKFPGGAAALQVYKHDVLGALCSGPGDEVQNSIFVRCTIDTSGKVIDVAEIQTNRDTAAAEKCLDAVRYMPDWSPGLYRGKPVNVCLMIDFSLK